MAATRRPPRPQPRAPAGGRRAARRARTTSTPSSAPATVPRLNAAWKRGMTVRPSRRSTSAPSTFIATSQAPTPAAVERPARPRRAGPSRRAPAPDARPRRARRPTASAPPRTTAAGAPPARPARPRWAARPATRRRSSAAAGRAPPLSRSRPERRSGTRETRLANSSPLSAKTTPTATVARVGVGSGSRLGHRFQSVPGGLASSQDWKPVREPVLIASSTSPAAELARDDEVVGVERHLLGAERLAAPVVAERRRAPTTALGRGASENSRNHSSARRSSDRPREPNRARPRRDGRGG